MNILIINAFNSSPNGPGGKRTKTWITLLEGHDVEVADIPTTSHGSVAVRYGKRLLGLLAGRPNVRRNYFERLVEDSKAFDLALICVPAYEVWELVPLLKNSGIKLVVDIRDGITRENLFLPLENFFFKNWLKYLESQIEDCDAVVTNIPSLQKQFADQYDVSPLLMLNHTKFGASLKGLPEKSASNGKRIMIYAGGLMKSSWGQSALQICKALRQTKTWHLCFVGRFNLLEKIVYSFIGRERITFENEIPEIELDDRLRKCDMALLINTTKRDLLPTKLFSYLGVGVPILSISPSKNVRDIICDIDGIVPCENDARKICKVLKDLEQGKLQLKNRRAGLSLDDDKRQIRKLFDNEFV